MENSDSEIIKINNDGDSKIVTGAQNEIDRLEKEKETLQDFADKAVKNGDGIGVFIYSAEIRQINRLIRVLKIIDGERGNKF